MAYVRQKQDLKRINALASQNFGTFTIAVKKGNCELNSEGIAPAGSVYPKSGELVETLNKAMHGGYNISMSNQSNNGNVLSNNKMLVDYKDAKSSVEPITIERGVLDGYPTIKVKSNFRRVGSICAINFIFRMNGTIKANNAITAQLKYRAIFHNPSDAGSSVGHIVFTGSAIPVGNMTLNVGSTNTFSNDNQIVINHQGFNYVAIKIQENLVSRDANVIAFRITLIPPTNTQNYQFGNTTLEIAHPMIHLGDHVSNRLPYAPSYEDQLLDILSPVGIIFEDVDFGLGTSNDTVIDAPILVEGYVFESRLPFPVTSEDKQKLDKITFR